MTDNNKEQTDLPAEETLDPKNWESMRKLGHRILDDARDYLETLRDRPVWQHAPPQVKAHFQGLPPLESEPADEVYQEYRKYIHPHQIRRTGTRAQRTGIDPAVPGTEGPRPQGVGVFHLQWHPRHHAAGQKPVARRRLQIGGAALQRGHLAETAQIDCLRLMA